MGFGKKILDRKIKKEKPDWDLHSDVVIRLEIKLFPV